MPDSRDRAARHLCLGEQFRLGHAHPVSAPSPRLSSRLVTRFPSHVPRGQVVCAVREGGAFTAGEGAVWSMNNDSSTLLRIDPS